jgi:3-phenylpropionate/trans-cinnamate dioxygenase ferredoxin subunit
LENVCARSLINKAACACVSLENDLPDFVPVAKVTDVPDPGKTLVEASDRLIVLIHAAGHWYALDDVCTHDGGPLSEGPVDSDEGTIACPRHGAKFDIKTGAALTMPATKPTVAHEVKVEGEKVLVRLRDAS